MGGSKKKNKSHTLWGMSRRWLSRREGLPTQTCAGMKISALRSRNLCILTYLRGNTALDPSCWGHVPAVSDALVFHLHSLPIFPYKAEEPLKPNFCFILITWFYFSECSLQPIIFFQYRTIDPLKPDFLYPVMPLCAPMLWSRETSFFIIIIQNGNDGVKP